PDDLGPLITIPPSILSWQFGSPATTGTESSLNATFNHPNLEISSLSRGEGLSPGGGFLRSFSSTSNSQHNSKANAIDRDEYFQFEVQAKPGNSVSLATISAKLSKNSTGAKS